MKFKDLIHLFYSDCKRYNYSLFRGITFSLLGIGPIQSVFFYRVSRFCYLNKLCGIHAIINRMNIILNNCEINPQCSIGSGLRIAHSTGIVIGNNATLGNNITLFHNTTIGAKTPYDGKVLMPKISDNVTIYTHSTILGDIFIGKNCTIGSHIFLVKDLEDYTTLFLDKNMSLVEKKNNRREQ
ncbi:serine O-acetyltransferase [Priestia megaterium]|uniref:serine O-acetyltransferase n=1 Tax=Priestia megaterium TaxID=1404 RepID=UPI0032D964AE